MLNNHLSILFRQVLIPALILIVVALSQETHGQDLRAINVVPDKEKRSIIRDVDGFAHLSENMTLAQTLAAAFANAKRLALEMAKTHIKSKTMIEDFELKYDLIWSEAEGVVSILEQKDYGIKDNTRYHVWIKAEVEYGLKPKGKLDPEHDMDSGLPLKIKVWTSNKEYKDGDNIEIFIQGNHDFYARVVDITSDGNIIQLLPNDYRKDNFFRAGVVYKIPDKSDAFDLKVAPPYGIDNVVVYASEVPLGDVSMESVGQGLSMYRGTQKSLAAKTRGISVVSADKKKGAEFYEATWSLKTSK